MNIAEILRSCPKGMKLYSPIFGEVTFTAVGLLDMIICHTPYDQACFFSDGKYVAVDKGECMLFPSKEQRDWNKFLIPFEDGDVIVTTDQTPRFPHENVAIFKEYNGRTDRNIMTVHCQFDANGNFNNFYQDVDANNWRKATNKEREEFFEKLNNEGYKWENYKLVIKPKFKVGDTITNGEDVVRITAIIKGCYKGYNINTNEEWVIPIAKDNWELAKFDLNSLKPYDRILTKSNSDSCWYPTLVSYVNSDGKVYTIDRDSVMYYVIPFEGNEHLIGKDDDPDRYYITW